MIAELQEHSRGAVRRGRAALTAARCATSSTVDAADRGAAKSAQREREGFVVREVAQLHGIAADPHHLEPERNLLAFLHQVQLTRRRDHRGSDGTGAGSPSAAMPSSCIGGRSGAIAAGRRLSSGRRRRAVMRVRRRAARGPVARRTGTGCARRSTATASCASPVRRRLISIRSRVRWRRGSRAPAGSRGRPSGCRTRRAGAPPARTALATTHAVSAPTAPTIRRHARDRHRNAAIVAPAQPGGQRGPLPAAGCGGAPLCYDSSCPSQLRPTRPRLPLSPHHRCHPRPLRVVALSRKGARANRRPHDDRARLPARRRVAERERRARRDRRPPRRRRRAGVWRRGAHDARDAPQRHRAARGGRRVARLRPRRERAGRRAARRSADDRRGHRAARRGRGRCRWARCAARSTIRPSSRARTW